MACLLVYVDIRNWFIRYCRTPVLQRLPSLSSKHGAPLYCIGGALFLSTVGNHESVWYGSDSLYQGYDSGGECGLAVDLVSGKSTALHSLLCVLVLNVDWGRV